MNTAVLAGIGIFLGTLLKRLFQTKIRDGYLKRLPDSSRLKRLMLFRIG